MGSLSSLRPHLFREWDDAPELWEKLGYSSVKKARWKCEYGHRWVARVSHRTITGSGCPACSGRIVNENNSLSAKFPHLEKHWSKNNSRRFGEVTGKSNAYALWVCEHGHEDRRKVADVTDAAVFWCRECNRIPDRLAREWSKTNKRPASAFTSGSGFLASWECGICGHIWKSSVYNRAKGSGCPKCAGCIVNDTNSIQAVAPSLESHWSPKNDVGFGDVVASTKKLYFWVCEHGHEVRESVVNRVQRKEKCLVCARSLGVRANWLRPQWSSKNNVVFDSVPWRSARICWWVCEEGHEWQARASDRTKGHGCPSCSRNHSKPEKLLESLLGVERFNKSSGVETGNGRCYRPDAQLSPTLFVNVDGLYWHGDQQKEKDYHFKMRENFEAEGLRLLQFWDDEIRLKPEIVKSMVDAVVGNVGVRLGARKCKIEERSKREINDFLAKNHIIGAVNYSSSLTLTYDNEIVQVFCWRRLKHVLEISRVASRLGTVVSGGLSRLLAEVIFRNQEVSEIVTYCDLRYADGHSLEKLGFERVSVTLDFQYSKGWNRRDKRLFRVKAGEPDKALAQGWWKVWGAGTAKYVKRLRLGPEGIEPPTKQL